jgi:hypothetical protein
VTPLCMYVDQVRGIQSEYTRARLMDCVKGMRLSCNIRSVMKSNSNANPLLLHCPLIRIRPPLHETC